jgi:hypothetical protein
MTHSKCLLLPFAVKDGSIKLESIPLIVVCFRLQKWENKCLDHLIHIKLFKTERELFLISQPACPLFFAITLSLLCTRKLARPCCVLVPYSGTAPSMTGTKKSPLTHCPVYFLFMFNLFPDSLNFINKYYSNLPFLFYLYQLSHSSSNNSHLDLLLPSCPFKHSLHNNQNDSLNPWPHYVILQL